VIGALYILLPGVEVSEGLPDGHPVHDLDKPPGVCSDRLPELGALPTVDAMRPAWVEDAAPFASHHTFSHGLSIPIIKFNRHVLFLRSLS
jgi:hypothetical protein